MCFFPPLHLKHWTGVLISQHISVPSQSYKPIHIFLILSMSKIEQLNHIWYQIRMCGVSFFRMFCCCCLCLFGSVSIYIRKTLKKMPKRGIILVRHLSVKNNEPYRSGNHSRFILTKKKKIKWKSWARYETNQIYIWFQSALRSTGM